MKYTHCLRTAVITLRYSVVAYVAFCCFILIFIPVYYGRHISGMKTKVWVPKLIDKNTTEERLNSNCVLVNVPLADFQKLFSNKPVSMVVNQDRLSIKFFGEMSGGKGNLVVASEEPIFDAFEHFPIGTSIANITVNKKGFVSTDLEPGSMLLCYAVSIITCLLAGLFTFIVTWVIQSLVGIGVGVTYVAATDGKKTPDELEEVFFPT